VWSQRVIPYSQIIASGAAPAAVRIDPSDVAVLQYTGGTTGLPKGAMLTHANLSINAQQATHHMPSMRDGEEKLMGVLPLFHVFAMTSILNGGILVGAELILHPRFEIGALMKSLVRDKPTIMHAVPTIYNAIATAAETQRVHISSLRVCVSGGAPLPTEIRERFMKLTGCRVIEGYGLTEASPTVTCNPPDGEVRAGSVGIAMQGTVIEIRGLDDIARLLPAGERGEICVRGPQVMKGYLNRPAETRDVLVDGALRTGDVGYLDADGYLYVTDRIKDLIICSGYNVYPRMIEDALYEHPAVAEAIAIGIADSYRGQVPLAFVTLRAGEVRTGEELREFLRDRLSPIELPVRVEIRTSLPKTMIGKLSRKELVAEAVTSNLT
jgi:long-chain acyl-CoA synthetase